MDMSKAALPPIHGTYTKADESHPLFPLYRQHRNFCIRELIAASAFRDWLYQYERNLESERAADHPRYEEFRTWMVDNQGGRRPCCPTRDNPRGLCFPHNFYHWLEGGRW